VGDRRAALNLAVSPSVWGRCHRRCWSALAPSKLRRLAACLRCAAAAFSARRRCRWWRSRKLPVGLACRSDSEGRTPGPSSGPAAPNPVSPIRRAFFPCFIPRESGSISVGRAEWRPGGSDGFLPGQIADSCEGCWSEGRLAHGRWEAGESIRILTGSSVLQVLALVELAFAWGFVTPGLPVPAFEDARASVPLPMELPGMLLAHLRPGAGIMLVWDCGRRHRSPAP